ncbi:hypothetical protein L195_g061832, partial [Trifolium pratense]
IGQSESAGGVGERFAAAVPGLCFGVLHAHHGLHGRNHGVADLQREALLPELGFLRVLLRVDAGCDVDLPAADADVALRGNDGAGALAVVVAGGQDDVAAGGADQGAGGNTGAARL